VVEVAEVVVAAMMIKHKPNLKYNCFYLFNLCINFCWQYGQCTSSFWCNVNLLSFKCIEITVGVCLCFLYTADWILPTHNWNIYIC